MLPNRAVAGKTLLDLLSDSSYQLEVLVASLEGLMAEERSAENLVIDSTPAAG